MRDPLILIGVSTGGIAALKVILRDLPVGCAPVAIVQHVPYDFSFGFIKELKEICQHEIAVAKEGDELLPERILFAPACAHLILRERNDFVTFGISHGRPENHFMPSVDILFKSACNIKSKRIVAAVLTGVGCDGAKGLLALRKAGAHTIAQDEDSSVVYGMPRAARELRAAQLVVPLDRMGAALSVMCRRTY